ncbi:SH3 domain-containing protein [Leeia aquatica]|uniref:SH3 domain-containing protein n=1 Tax=Leeia aquatica TaxID=2725557 RepID=A0A847RSG4_9NEIS|nr:SH3 domain-containing protein [Leeia aquatica]NLR74150.1 SH3 domain-containing protein [Leeia aquatica]
MRFVHGLGIMAGVLAVSLTAQAASLAPPQLAVSAAQADQRASCNFTAFVQETDPAGLNVRQAPGVSAKVLGHLPPVWRNREMGIFPVRIEVEVVAAQGGWFQIQHARDNPDLTGLPARKVFTGRGWVSGAKLVVKSQASKAYARPSVRSPVVLQLQDGAFDSDEMVRAGQLLACSGHWALVAWRRDKLSADLQAQMQPGAGQGKPPARFQGWVNQLCGLQETSCSGLAGQD